LDECTNKGKTLSFDILERKKDEARIKKMGGTNLDAKTGEKGVGGCVLREVKIILGVVVREGT